MYDDRKNPNIGKKQILTIFLVKKNGHKLYLSISGSIYLVIMKERVQI